jgi:Uma2 family endonuclease
MASVPTALEVDLTDYPSSDGRPMAETDLHRDIMFEVIETLKGYYESDPNVYVSGNLLVYYERGNPRRCLAPDCFVLRGVPKRRRKLYKIWDEGKAPEVVIEVTSNTTRNEDADDKFAIYRDVWKVREYFLFDPLGDYLEPPLQGYRLADSGYQSIEPTFGRLYSEVLDLNLEGFGPHLRLLNATTNEVLLPPGYREARAARAERERLEAERLREQLRREQAEAELERLRQELDALRNRPTEGS